MRAGCKQFYPFCLSRFGTYLGHSILDTSAQFCASCGLMHEAAKGYTELAFEGIWLVSRQPPVRREFEFCISGCGDAWDTERRRWLLSARVEPI